MPSANQIKALLKSHFEQDNERFCSIAMQVAAHEARLGHGRFADEIKSIIDKARAHTKHEKSVKPIPIATPKGELAGLLSVSYPETRLKDMVLTPKIYTRLNRVLREQQSRDKLASYSLQPRRKVLLMGPPGSGKTMTASAVAGELRLPLYLIVLDVLITKYMGETAAKLRLVFEALTEYRGVYLFDEFDAIGGHRNAGNDVGEIRRVLNSFLMFLEQDTSESLILAATNHPGALDRALFRRFDDVIEYEFPPLDLIKKTLRSRLSSFSIDAIDWEISAQKAQGLSYSDITRACESAAKDAILDGSDIINTERLLNSIQECIDTQPPK